MTEEMLFGFLIGLAIGSVVSVISYFITVKMTDSINRKAGQTNNGVGRMFAVRYALDIITLVIVFLLRDAIPYDFEFMLIGAVLGLTVPGRLLLNGYAQKVTEKEKPIAEKIAARQRAEREEAERLQAEQQKQQSEDAEQSSL